MPHMHMYIEFSGPKFVTCPRFPATPKLLHQVAIGPFPTIHNKLSVHCCTFIPRGFAHHHVPIPKQIQAFGFTFVPIVTTVLDVYLHYVDLHMESWKGLLATSPYVCLSRASQLWTQPACTMKVHAIFPMELMNMHALVSGSACWPICLVIWRYNCNLSLSLNMDVLYPVPCEWMCISTY